MIMVIFMEIRVLQYFLTIVREESFTKAAEVLHLTQPTLSRQIKELEASLGKPLLIRGKRKVSLTEYGMLLRQRAEEIVKLAEKAEMELMASDISLTGDIYIGSGETEGIRFIIQAIKKMQEVHPKVKFHLYSGNADDVTDRLEKGLLDFGLLIHSPNMEQYHNIKIPTHDTWGVLMKKDDPLASHQAIAFSDIRDQPLILSRQNMYTNEIASWLGGDIDQLNIVGTYNLLYNASLMVEAGIGYALCLDKIINTTGNSNLVFVPLTPQTTVALSFVWKKFRTLSKSANAFLEMIQRT